MGAGLSILVRHILRGGVLLPVAAAAWAQADDQRLRALHDLHDKLTRPRLAVSVEDGQAARAQLREWRLSRKELSEEQRGWLTRAELYAALAVGDAGGADASLGELQRLAPDARETDRAAWLVANATGDAEAARKTLERLRAQGAASETALARRLGRLAMIGQSAPDAELRPEKEKPIPLQRRDGVVLVVDFWRYAKKPEDEQIAALRALVQSFGPNDPVRFVGVHTGTAADTDAAKKFVAANKLTWPQCYEQRSGGAAATEQAFKVDAPPWHVLIDAEGNVRAVGVAGEPEFEYAVRAAVAEAQGQYAAMRPKTTDGVTAAARPKPAEEVAVAPTGDLPHNDEARSMVDQARAYLKTGLKHDAKKLLQEVVEKYPGTWEAREAKRLLDTL